MRCGLMLEVRVKTNLIIQIDYFIITAVIAVHISERSLQAKYRRGMVITLLGKTTSCGYCNKFLGSGQTPPITFLRDIVLTANQHLVSTILLDIWSCRGWKFTPKQILPTPQMSPMSHFYKQPPQVAVVVVGWRWSRIFMIIICRLIWLTVPRYKESLLLPETALALSFY